jgi:2-dehydropantoate 2-reductase
VDVEDAVRPRDHFDEAHVFFPLLEDARRQTGSVRPGPSGDAVFDPDAGTRDQFDPIQARGARSRSGGRDREGGSSDNPSGVKIAIVGAGAMGSVYAALLASVGAEVWAVDVNVEHVEAIRARGLRVEGASGDRTVRIGATTNPDEAGPVDLVVVATKSMHAQVAARSLGPLLGADTTVLTIQNGLGAADVVADVVGAGRLMVGVAGGFGASVVGPGHVYHHGLELLRLGEYAGPVTARTEQVADAWRQAGFAVKTYDDVGQLVWEKLICNVAFAGPCAVLELTIGEAIDNPHAWSVATRCAEEALEVARALGVVVAVDDAAAYVRRYGLAIPGARPSVLLDLLAGRPCEIEWINGSIPREGRRLGLQAPTNDLVTTLVLAKQRQRRAADHSHG